MANRGFYKNTTGNVIAIVKALKESHRQGRDYMTVSEIAKTTGLHKWTVSRTVDIWMNSLVDAVVPQELEDIGMKIKLVRLTDPNVTEDTVLRSIRFRV